MVDTVQRALIERRLERLSGEIFRLEEPIRELQRQQEELKKRKLLFYIVSEKDFDTALVALAGRSLLGNERYEVIQPREECLGELIPTPLTLSETIEALMVTFDREGDEGLSRLFAEQAISTSSCIFYEEKNSPYHVPLDEHSIFHFLYSRHYLTTLTTEPEAHIITTEATVYRPSLKEAMHPDRYLNPQSVSPEDSAVAQLAKLIHDDKTAVELLSHIVKNYMAGGIKLDFNFKEDMMVGMLYPITVSLEQVENRLKPFLTLRAGYTTPTNFIAIITPREERQSPVLK